MKTRLRRALSSLWLHALIAVAALVLLSAAPGLQAQEAPTGLAADLESQVRQFALDGSHPAGATAPRIEVSIGSLDPRLRLAPCQRIEPYLPTGMRLWGKARIGLRCVEGTSKWNVYLPVTVRVFGPGLVASNGAAVGAVLGAADVMTAEVDLAEDNSAAVTDANLAVGHAVTRTLKPGQSLRQSDLKPRQWFTAGDTVKVVAQGPGFSVSGEGQALTNGTEGQTARVRIDNGRVVSGQPTGEHQIELAL
jgi:flagella basal body P-ring formation protein FlgA